MPPQEARRLVSKLSHYRFRYSVPGIARRAIMILSRLGYFYATSSRRVLPAFPRFSPGDPGQQTGQQSSSVAGPSDDAGVEQSAISASDPAVSNARAPHSCQRPAYVETDSL